MSHKRDPKRDPDRKPYSKPTLTVHGDLRIITATKASNRRETGRPRTFNGNNNW